MNPRTFLTRRLITIGAAVFVCLIQQATAQPNWTGFVDILRDAAPPLSGTLTENENSFVLGGVGFAAFGDTAESVGDNLSFRYETVTGDFDKQVRLASLTTEPFFGAEVQTRAGLMVRASTNANELALEIAAANPAPDEGLGEGANRVRVAGRARVDQIYSQQLSRNYPGVRDTLPNQWLRMRRVGDAWAFFVGTNGVDWSLIAEQYQVLPAEVLVGVFASPDNVQGDSRAMAEFAEYGDYVPAETGAPRLVSVGTLDKQTVGVKFSEVVKSATATQIGNYSISEGTIASARMGISGDSVYLSVSGLTSDTFSVTVVGGVEDAAGNLIVPNSTAQGEVSNWISTDIGHIQDPNNRPTPGDDPHVVGQAVAVSSGPNPEIEIVGGGSNAYNIGDYMHYLYREYTGDFDVVVAIERFDKRGIAGGYSNAGIHVRAGLYRTDNNEIGEKTKVPSYVNITYYEASDPNRAAIELNRPAPGDNYGNNGPIDNNFEIGGLLGYFTGLRAVNAAGDLAEQTSPTQAKWLRVTRVGQEFTSYLSYNGVDWLEMTDSVLTMANLPETVLVGIGNQNDSGYGVPPEGSTYAGNGTPYQNESNYGVLRISALGDYPPPSPTLVFFPFDGDYSSDGASLTGGSPAGAGALPPLVDESPTGQPGDQSASFDGTAAGGIGYWTDAQDLINFDDQDYTLEAWVRIGAGGAAGAGNPKGMILGYGIPGGYSMWISAEGTLSGTTYGIVDLTTDAVVPATGWHHVALVHQVGTEVRFYLDGALAATLPETRGVDPTTDNNLYIGYERGSAEPLNPFNGLIDRIRITGRALLPEELDLAGASAGGIQSIEVVGEDIVITYEGTLMSADEVTGPYLEVPDAASPQVVQPEGEKRYFMAK